MKKTSFLPCNLTKYLSLCGIASRRKCSDLIKKGMIKVNGVVVANPATQINENDKVEYKGKHVCPISNFIYVLLNKPRGYVCSSSDPHNNNLACNLIKIPGIRLFSAGRLDKDSEGMIIFSNDGDYVNKLTHPANQIIKTYKVHTSEPLSDENIAKMLDGILDNCETLKAEKITKVSKDIYIFKLKEGKKREIRRLVEFAGAKVKTLERIAIGKLELGDIKKGKWRFLNKSEIAMSLEKG